MAKFIDSAQREWTIALDAPTIMRVREECDPDFLKHDDDEERGTYRRLVSDPVLLCRVIYVLCEKQRRERSVSEESFYLEVIGDAIDSATAALLEAIVNFTPRRTRELLKATAAKLDAMYSLSKARTDRILERMNQEDFQRAATTEIDRRIDDALKKIGIAPSSATNSPDTAESAPKA